MSNVRRRCDDDDCGGVDTAPGRVWRGGGVGWATSGLTRVEMAQVLLKTSPVRLQATRTQRRPYVLQVFSIVVDVVAH